MVHLPGHGDHEALSRALADAEELRGRLAAIERSDAYQIGQQVVAVVDGVVADEAELLQAVSGDVDEAFAKARAAELRRRAAPVIKARVAARLAEETGAIDQEVEIEADEAAAAAVTKFRETEAGTYRARVRDRLVRARVADAVLAARRAIDVDVAGEVAAEDIGGVTVAAGDVVTTRPKPETKTQLKTRAAEIRRQTHDSQILPYTLLRTDDVLTLCFVYEGHGKDQYTTGSSGGWSSTYDSTRETRRLKLKLLDAEHGTFEVVRDSYRDEPTMEGYAIRPGREILVLSADPDDDQERLAPMLVKATQVTLQALKGKTVGNTREELWWVGLGDDELRILS